MTDTTSYQLLIAAFDDESDGVAAVGRLSDAFRANRAAMPAAASIVKDAAGALTIVETTDIGGKQGATAGALAGGLIGLLSRKRGAVSTAALGALLGGVAAHKMDTGIPDPRLEAIGASLDASSSAAVAVVSDEAFGEAKALLSGMGATTTAEAFDYDTDFVQQMKEGDYRRAMVSLADRAESMVAMASGTASDAVRQARDEVEEIGRQKEPTQSDEDYKPVPQEKPALVEGADAVPDSDTPGGVARADIDPTGAGLPDVRPPAL
jgi:uncharacterized membrane protein